MEKQQGQEERQEEGYQPRPAYQVWGARILLVVFIGLLIGVYWKLFYGGV